jgi:hypothetical protein
MLREGLNMLMRGPFLVAILCCAVSAQRGVLAATPAVSLGLHHSVALARDGTVLTWGNDGSGQLGLGRRLSSAAPLALGALTGATGLLAAEQYSLAIAADGTAWGWGTDIALGGGSTPGRIPELPLMRAISGRKYHALGLAADGTVWAWGANNYGQIGNGNTTAQDRPVQVPGLTGITAVAVGIYHSVALRGDDGAVFTWGDNGNGQIGNGTTERPAHAGTGAGTRERHEDLRGRRFHARAEIRRQRNGHGARTSTVNSATAPSPIARHPRKCAAFRAARRRSRPATPTPSR